MFRRDIVHDARRLPPHLLVVAVEKGHGPVAPAQQAAGSERSTATATASRRSAAPQSPSGRAVLRPEILAVTLPCAAAFRSARSQLCIWSLRRGGLPRWSITIVMSGKLAASSGTSPRWRGKTQGNSRISRRSCTRARLSSTASPRIQWASGSSWMRWRNPRSFGWLASSASRSRARSGERRSSQAMTAPIHSCRQACANIASVSASVHAAWTSTVFVTPAGRRSGSRSAGSNVRWMTACSAVIQARSSRSRFQKCWCASTITSALLRLACAATGPRCHRDGTGGDWPGVRRS